MFSNYMFFFQEVFGRSSCSDAHPFVHLLLMEVCFGFGMCWWSLCSCCSLMPSLGPQSAKEDFWSVLVRPRKGQPNHSAQNPATREVAYTVSQCIFLVFRHLHGHLLTCKWKTIFWQNIQPEGFSHWPTWLGWWMFGAA